jgi:WhiB family transcriptional regulator, redox-sensing transcriptional regulator
MATHSSSGHGMSWPRDCTPQVTPYVPQAGDRAAVENQILYSLSLLLRPAGKMPWTRRAICSQVGGDAFYPEPGGSGRGDVERAKKVCRECPVLDPCLEYALEHEPKFGVWGATTPEERQQIRRARAA